MNRNTLYDSFPTSWQRRIYSYTMNDTFQTRNVLFVSVHSGVLSYVANSHIHELLECSCITSANYAVRYIYYSAYIVVVTSWHVTGGSTPHPATSLCGYAKSCVMVWCEHANTRTWKRERTPNRWSIVHDAGDDWRVVLQYSVARSVSFVRLRVCICSAMVIDILCCMFTTLKRSIHHGRSMQTRVRRPHWPIPIRNSFD